MLQSLSERQEVMGAHLGSFGSHIHHVWALVLSGLILKSSSLAQVRVPTAHPYQLLGHLRPSSCQSRLAHHQQACTSCDPLARGTWASLVYREPRPGPQRRVHWQHLGTPHHQWVASAQDSGDFQALHQWSKHGQRTTSRSCSQRPSGFTMHESELALALCLQGLCFFTPPII